MKASIRFVTPLVAVAAIASALVVLIPQIAHAEGGVCPLTEGSVINKDGTAWDEEFIRSDYGVADSQHGPVAVDIPAGEYDVVLVSHDDHSLPIPPQSNERWFIEAYNGNTKVYTSPAISDLPESQDDLIEIVDRGVPIPAITKVLVMHAGYPDATSPNSLFAVCVAFVVNGVFVDDNDSVFETDIEWMFNQGITKGCNPPKNDEFCPEDRVTREQMAAFIVRAMGYVDDGGGDLFDDDDLSIFEHDIDRLGAAGVTKGCNPPANNLFCPASFVTRGQMAAFLHRALG